MNEKEMGDALLRFGPEADAKQMTQRILDRDTVRVRILLWFTVCVWLFATGLVLISMIQYALLFPAQAKLAMDVDAGLMTVAERDSAQVSILVGFQKASLLVTLAVAKMCFAALCTVALVLFSRRATLRQVNAGLMEVTAELRRLRPAS